MLLNEIFKNSNYDDTQFTDIENRHWKAELLLKIQGV